ncbi:unnamed protein product [Sphagnum jensenii]|uniref:Uncharacterized protein n=1 Tax=Sphagnum jensenii TaxID=128206 RepID=A0ABP1BF75_9BRYO
MRELVHNHVLSNVRGWNGLWTGRKSKQLQKMLSNFKVTILCGFITLLVFRGTLAGRNFYSVPAAQDLSVLHGLQLQEGGGGGSSNEELRRMWDAENKEEEENDPPPRDPNTPYTLGPEIKDWNEQRALWLSKNPQMAKTSNDKKDRILLVSGSQPKPCDNAVGDHYLVKGMKNKIDYCRLHDIEFFYNMAFLDQEMSGFWSKLPLIRKLMLAHPEVEWIWWMDSDAMFTDMVFELPLEKYQNHNLVVHGYDNMMANKSWVSLNTGSFLFRNCQWSLDLLDVWAPMGPKGPIRIEAGKLLTKTLAERPDFEADDQSALIYLLITQSELWSNKVFLESSFYLHGYWMIIVDKYEEIMEKYHPGFGDERWPFVTHFVGCKPCNSYHDHSIELCLAQMERAFNFADNQILQLLGYQHLGLQTDKVKRTRNETADPLNLHLPIPKE